MIEMTMHTLNENGETVYASTAIGSLAHLAPVAELWMKDFRADRKVTWTVDGAPRVLAYFGAEPELHDHTAGTVNCTMCL